MPAGPVNVAQASEMDNHRTTTVVVAIIGVVVRQIALMSIFFTGNTRLPMVAGWDRLLPLWFARLHENTAHR